MHAYVIRDNLFEQYRSVGEYSEYFPTTESTFYSNTPYCTQYAHSIYVCMYKCIRMAMISYYGQLSLAPTIMCIN